MSESPTSQFTVRLERHPLSAPSFLFVIFLIALAWTGKYFGVNPNETLVSFALLFAPYWFLGFGLDSFLVRRLDQRWKRLSAPVALVFPWLVFTIPRSEFDVRMFAALLGGILTICCLAEIARKEAAPHWCDWVSLALLALAVELPYFRGAWNAPGLSGASKLLFVDTGLFAFMVIRPIGGIGFDLRARAADFAIGLREFTFYAPIALMLGFALGFLHWHPAGFPLAQLVAAWIFTLFFVALPEEIFFRGLLLNLMERKWGTRTALIGTALVFGLAHFPKRAAFNWRYVILAAVAGLFYGRAWLARRRVLASGVTHATVDAVWSVWFR